ncbi:MAG: SgcJ/EcaC family oxidoreductase [Thermoanaerobaculia bacterium]
MKRNLFWPVALACSLSAASIHAQTSRDEAALRRLPVAFCEAWAKHDGHELAKVMADDVDFVTVGGTWLRGRADFETYHSRLLSGRFQQSTNRLLKSDVRFLGSKTAVVHWTWSIQGDSDPDGTPRPLRFGLMTMLAEKRHHRWQVAAAQNTNAAPAPPPEAEGIHSPLSLPATPERDVKPASKRRTDMKHATGEFDVKVLPQGEVDKAIGSSLGRMSIDKQFHGELEGTGKGEMLTAMTDVKGSAAYVALERVTGTLHARSGSFVLLHNGVMSSSSQQLSLTVVPDSGSEALTGISGTMTIVNDGGKHSYDFAYALPGTD